MIIMTITQAKIDKIDKCLSELSKRQNSSYRQFVA